MYVSWANSMNHHSWFVPSNKGAWPYTANPVRHWLVDIILWLSVFLIYYPRRITDKRAGSFENKYGRSSVPDIWCPSELGNKSEPGVLWTTTIKHTWRYKNSWFCDNISNCSQMMQDLLGFMNKEVRKQFFSLMFCSSSPYVPKLL